jgi:hypothetical protein
MRGTLCNSGTTQRPGCRRTGPTPSQGKALVPDLVKYYQDIRQTQQDLQSDWVVKTGNASESSLSNKLVDAYPALIWCACPVLSASERAQHLDEQSLSSKSVSYHLAGLLPKVRESRDRTFRVRKGPAEKAQTEAGSYLYPCCGQTDETNAGSSIECSTCLEWVHFDCERLTAAPPRKTKYRCKSCLSDQGKRSPASDLRPGKRQPKARDLD